MRAKQFIFDGSTNNYAGYVVGNQNQRKFTSMDDVPEKVATSYLGKVDPETERQKFVRQDNAQQQAAITQNGRQPMYRDHGAQNVSQVGDRPGDQGKIVVDRTPTNNMVNTVTGDTAQGSSTTDSLGQSSTRGGGGYGQGEKTVTTQANIETDRRGSTYKPPSEASSLKEPTFTGYRDSQFELIRPHAAAIDKAAAEKFADPNDKTTKLAQAERTRKFEKTASDMIKTNANAMKSAVDDNSDEVRSIENGRHVVRRPDRRVVDLGNNAGPGKLTTGTMATDVNRAGNQAAEVAYKQRKAPAVVRSSAPAAAAATSYSAPPAPTIPAPTPVVAPKPAPTIPAPTPVVAPKPVIKAVAPKPVIKAVAPPKQATSYSAEQKLREFENWVNEAEMKNDPCWDGYEMIGHKEKGGKKVPNCVPKKSVKEQAPMEYEGEPPQQKTNPIGVIRQGKKVYDMVKGGKVKDTATQTVIDIIKNATRDDASSRNRLPNFLKPKD